MLEEVYGTYKEMHGFAGRQGQGLTLGAWDQMLRDADVEEARAINPSFGLLDGLA